MYFSLEYYIVHKRCRTSICISSSLRLFFYSFEIEVVLIIVRLRQLLVFLLDIICKCRDGSLLAAARGSLQL